MRKGIRCRHILVIATTFCGLLGLPACSGESPTHCPSGIFISACYSVPQPARRGVDILFVIDSSSAIEGLQPTLRANYPALMTALRHMVGGLPDVHIGVITTDVGVGPHAVPGCSRDGHGGRMHTGGCPSPFGATYLKDVAPSGCTITRGADSTCSDDNCAQQNCGHELGTWLVIDEPTGCPRCRNYFEDHLENAFGCIADVSTSGCPFSQPLEAMRQAIGNHVNSRFVRDDAFLVVFFITAQDDCSAADARIFDPSDTTLDSPLGPLTPFRCFEQGVTCDVNDRSPGMRHGCVPRDDPEMLLGSLDHYADFLRALKDPQMLVVTAVAGPVMPSPDGIGHGVVVGQDTQQLPMLEPSCATASGGATPSIRMYSFIDRFNEEEDLGAWAYTSACSADYTAALAGTPHPHNNGWTICNPAPLKGCTDPAAAQGLEGDGQPCNDTCLPQCTVTDVQQRGTDRETQALVPYCLEVCSDGPCPGNTDPNLAFAMGQPHERDFRLPVPVCWFVSSVVCGANGEIVVARRETPPPRTFIDVCCALVPDAETNCDDGLDGDEDCLVDLDDPDCTPE